MYKLITTTVAALTLVACYNESRLSPVNNGELALTACHQLENGLEICMDFDAQCHSEGASVLCTSVAEPVAGQTIGDVRAPRVVESDRLGELDLGDGMEPLPELTPKFIDEACDSCPSCNNDSCIACVICAAAPRHDPLVDDDRLGYDSDVDTDNANIPTYGE